MSACQSLHFLKSCIAFMQLLKELLANLLPLSYRQLCNILFLIASVHIIEKALSISLLYASHFPVVIQDFWKLRFSLKTVCRLLLCELVCVCTTRILVCSSCAISAPSLQLTRPLPFSLLPKGLYLFSCFCIFVKTQLR